MQRPRAEGIIERRADFMTGDMFAAAGDFAVIGMLLKGLGEMRMAPSPLHAAEMLIIRMAYASGLPSPADALKALAGGSGGSDGGRAPAASRPGAPAASAGPP